MTAANATPTPAELVRQRANEMMEDRDGDLALVDAMLTILAERDALAAILAEVRQVAEENEDVPGDALLKIVGPKPPADALAAVKEAVWEEGMDAAIEYERGMTRDPKLLDNPYRIERERQR